MLPRPLALTLIAALLAAPGTADAKGGPLSWLFGSRILNPRHWNGGYPKGARVISRKPDALDEQMLQSSYDTDEHGRLQQREVLSVRLLSRTLPLESHDAFGGAYSVDGVDSQIAHL